MLHGSVLNYEFCFGGEDALLGNLVHFDSLLPSVWRLAGSGQI